MNAKGKGDKMKAIRYKIKVCDGVLGHIHGFRYDLEEMYIPDLHLFVNSESVFIEEEKHNEETRIKNSTDLVEFELPSSMEVTAKALVKSIKSKKELESALRRYFINEAKEEPEKKDIFRCPDSSLYYGIATKKWDHEYARNALINFIDEKGLTQVAMDWVEENIGWEED